MDKIFIRNLKINAILGILPHERTQAQTLLINVEMAIAIQKAASSGKLHDTIDYAAVSQRIISFVSASHYHLVETLAEELAQLLCREFPTSWLRLQIGKTAAVPEAEEVGVIIERKQS